MARRHCRDVRRPGAARLAALDEATRSYHLSQEDFEAVIDGMAMDAERDIRAPDWATLDLYCDRVASAVGRLSVRIFGLPDDPGVALAHHLGRALQLTNILRDIDEDASAGPALPAARGAHGRGGDDGGSISCRRGPEARRRPASRWLRAPASISTRLNPIMAAAPRAAVKAPRLMAAAYGSILDRMVNEGFAPPRRRARASRLRLIGALLRYGIL